MVEEYFYGITLEGENAKFTWDAMAMKDDEADGNGGYGGPDATHKLLIRQIILGAKAGDEINVIEVETVSVKGKIKIPICVLSAAKDRHLTTDLEFPDSPVIFTLTQGKGPVHLLGQHLEQLTEEEIAMDDEVEDEADEDEFSDDQDVPTKKDNDGNAAKKMKLSENNHKKAEKAKKAVKKE